MAGSQQLDAAAEISSAELKELAPKRASAAPASFPTSTADLQPMIEALRLKAMPSFNQAASFVREQVATAGLRLQQDTLFSTLEDFERVDPDAKRIVVIGVTGAGKSTFARLVARFHDPTHGAVTLDGVDLREVADEDLRRAVVLVTQESFLFGGSVADNIALGRPGATRAEVEARVEYLKGSAA